MRLSAASKIASCSIQQLWKDFQKCLGSFTSGDLADALPAVRTVGDIVGADPDSVTDVVERP